MKDIKSKIKEIIEKFPTLSNREIGKLVNKSRSTVEYHLHSLGIHRDRKTQQKLNNTKRSFDINITDNAEQIILGSILGDGMMTKWHRYKDSHKNINSMLVIQHTEPQKEYIEYKKTLLENEGIVCHLKCYSKEFLLKYQHCINNIKVKVNNRYVLTTRKAITFNKYRDLFYKNKKYVNKYIYKLTALGLAIWFMDDGSYNNNRYFLHTNCFDKHSLYILQDMLKRNFNVYTTLNKTQRDNRFKLYIRAISREHFTDIIAPYICDSMKYKINRRL